MGQRPISWSMKCQSPIVISSPPKENGGTNPPILEESNVGDDLDHERGGSVL